MCVSVYSIMEVPYFQIIIVHSNLDILPFPHTTYL